MPILAREPDLYPNNLFESPEFTNVSWWAVMSRPRHVKAIARVLYAQKVPFYLPIREHKTRVRKVMVPVFEPLFPEYLFIATDASKLAAQRTNMAVHLLPAENAVQVVSDLRDVQRLLAISGSIYCEPQFTTGQRVRISRGSFRGMEGIALERRGRWHFMIMVRFMGQGVSVEIEWKDVDPL